MQLFFLRNISLNYSSLSNEYRHDGKNHQLDRLYGLSIKYKNLKRERENIYSYPSPLSLLYLSHCQIITECLINRLAYSYVH